MRPHIVLHPDQSPTPGTLLLRLTFQTMRRDDPLSEPGILVSPRLAEAIDEANADPSRPTSTHLVNADYLGKCEQCGHTFDIRDLGSLLHHNLMGKGHKPLPRN